MRAQGEFDELVADSRTFVALDAQSRSIFDLEKRLPAQVFQKAIGKYYAFEYALIFRNDFATLLSSIADQFKDKTIHYMTLEPGPEYYYNHYGFFGLASFSPVDLQTRYVKTMTRNGAADSFQVRGGDICVFWGSSLAWGIFCDRISWELCVMGIAGNQQLSIPRGFPLMELNNVGSYISAAYHWKPSVASEFMRVFNKTYLRDQE
jgi:hypothetical protein